MTRKNQTESRGRRFTPALVLSIVAVFMALSGAAVALPGQNTVTSGDIVDNTIKSVDLKDNKAVDSIDVVDEAITATDVAPDAAGQSELAPNSVRASELGDGIHAHTNSTLVNGGTGQNANYNTGTVTASCAAGEELLSGSGHWADGQAGEELVLSEVQLNHNTEQVTVRGGNDSGTDRTVVAVAHCLG